MTCNCIFLPGRSGDKIAFQQPQLAEQNPVDKRHSGQLLQGQMGLELEFLLFHEEGHCFWCLFTRIQHGYGELNSTKRATLSENVLSAAGNFSLCSHGNAASSEMIQHTNLRTNPVVVVTDVVQRGESVALFFVHEYQRTYLETFWALGLHQQRSSSIK